MKNRVNQPILWPFVLWLSAFYLAWLVFVVHGEYVQTALDHWQIAVAMAAGSYVAGSTPMGGGTVGFPVLVLLMDLPAVMGRDFSFAVQSVGMTSATIYILCRRLPLEWPMLQAALLGTLIGTPIGILYVAPLVSDLFIKLLFAAMWCSFGLLHLRRLNEFAAYIGMTPHNKAFDYRAGFGVGLLGGLTIASITGVGVDMMLYMILVLWCHADLKIAIPTSVILMAFTSIVGLAVKLLVGDVQPGTFEHWLAAAPIVVIGAPLGALVVTRIGRRPTVMVVSALCVIQFFWTLVHERSVLTFWHVAIAFLGVIAFLLLFAGMYHQGQRLARRSRATGPGTPCS